MTFAEQPLVHAQEHWAFDNLKIPELPLIEGSERARSSFDLFLLNQLHSKELRFSPDADSLTLLRRAYFDLIGLPPSPELIDQWRDVDTPNAYERLLDRMLASPHFGERWGQHWLDIAGFCPDRDNKWRYRDYVTNALNTDKPVNRFLVEQIAGDELVDWRTAEQMTPEIRELLMATGYLRCARDLAADNMTDIPEIRYATIFKTLEIFGTGVLGVTLQCARCHNHKFDPIPQRDYYRIMALITPAFNPQNWIRPGARHLDNGRIVALYDVGPPPETYLLRSGNFLAPGDPVRPGFLSALSESDETALVTNTKATGKTSGRRLALAHWLTKPNTPSCALATRVIVNRIWQHLFGRGIVGTPDNFGTGGVPPTHPDLIEHLANEFVRGEWSRKTLIRRLMSSTAYRQSSSQRLDAERQKDPLSLDPDNKLLWRMPLKRLESEIIRDAMLAVSGQLNERLGGAHIPLKNTVAGGLLAIDMEKLGDPADPWRRSIYLGGHRVDGGTSPQPNIILLSVFDQPHLHSNCTRRESSNVVLQSLTLLNDSLVLEQADEFAKRVIHDIPSAEKGQRIQWAFRIALGRPPHDDELTASRTFLEEQTATYLDQGETSDAANAKALATLCHALLSTNNFLYVE